MPDDLVKQLRSYDCGDAICNPICMKAADEIERLRALLKDARPYVEFCADDALPNPAADVLKKIDQENLA